MERDPWSCWKVAPTVMHEAGAAGVACSLQAKVLLGATGRGRARSCLLLLRRQRTGHSFPSAQTWGGLWPACCCSVACAPRPGTAPTLARVTLLPNPHSIILTLAYTCCKRSRLRRPRAPTMRSLRSPPAHAQQAASPSEVGMHARNASACAGFECPHCIFVCLLPAPATHAALHHLSNLGRAITRTQHAHTHTHTGPQKHT